MEVETVLFRKMEIPESEDRIREELQKSQRRFIERSSGSHWEQARIDELEYVLNCRRKRYV